jgi:hypothetical protein
MELRERGEGKENDRASIHHNIRCEGRGYKDMY